MAKPEIDEAFEWLIVILGIVSAILSGYPQYFYSVSPHPDRPIPLRVAMSIVPPMIITIGLWLIGKLSSKRQVKAVAKVVSWMFILGVTYLNLMSYFSGILLALGLFSIRDFSEVGTRLAWIGFFLIELIVLYFVVIPKYREIYPDLSFLKSKIQFLITYLATNVFVFMLMMNLA